MRAAGAAQMPAASGIYRQRRAFIALGLRQLAALAATFKSLVAKSKFERYRAHVTPLTPPAAPPPLPYCPPQLARERKLRVPPVASGYATYICQIRQQCWRISVQAYTAHRRKNS